GAIQAIARFLDKPVLASELGEVRVEVFETPAPVPRADLPSLLRALVDAHGLVLEDDSLYYRVLRPEPIAPPPDAPASQVGPTDQVLRLFTIRLRHARAADVAATLNQLFGAGDVFARPAG